MSSNRVDIPFFLERGGAGGSAAGGWFGKPFVVSRTVVESSIDIGKAISVVFAFLLSMNLSN